MRRRLGLQGLQWVGLKVGLDVLRVSRPRPLTEANHIGGTNLCIDSRPWAQGIDSVRPLICWKLDNRGLLGPRDRVVVQRDLRDGILNVVRLCPAQLVALNRSTAVERLVPGDGHRVGGVTHCPNHCRLDRTHGLRTHRRGDGHPVRGTRNVHGHHVSVIPGTGLQVVSGVCAGYLLQSGGDLHNLSRFQRVVRHGKPQLVRRHRRPVALRLVPGEAHALGLHFRALDLGDVIRRSRVGRHRLTGSRVLCISNFVSRIHLRVVRMPRQQTLDVESRVVGRQILLKSVLLHLRIMREFEVEALDRRPIAIGGRPSDLQRVRCLLRHVRWLWMVRWLGLQCRDAL
mmetsp:Transcript_85496/g.228650  ORF Transcript_85496/g.228650 Transcript_85496/m.228650 type:complete len:343 (-) Transcript_85496:3002-4030(-)